MGFFLESLNPQDIPKVNSVLRLAGWTWPVYDLVIDEDVFVGDVLTSSEDSRQTDGDEQQGIDTDEGFDDFEANSEPYDEQQCASGEVE